MTVPPLPSDPGRSRPDPTDPARPGGPLGGLDPRPTSRPLPPAGDRPPDVPDPARPGRRPGAPEPGGRLRLVALGRDDRLRHVVDVAVGELGDPEALRARCGAAVERVRAVGGGGPGGPDGPGADVECPICAAADPPA